MQDAADQDTCRICSAPAEPDQPLFHPCKCSGTIRYIHQDCLTTWLAHSKKKNCDVCKHPYAFTKVYSSDMPSSLPPLLLMQRLVQQLFMALLFVLRGIAVAAIWLGVLPWVTVWTWRMYFSMGESTAWWISDKTRPPAPESIPFYSKIHYEHAPIPAKGPIGWVLSHPAWVALSADIFTGQIIASLIVLTFVAVFLLREWIQQNARPGVFEEEDPLPADWVPPVNPDEIPQNPHANPEPFPVLEPDIAIRQAAAMHAVHALRRNRAADEEVPSAARRRRRIKMAKAEGARRRVFAGRTPPPQARTRRRRPPPPTLDEANNFTFTFQSRVPSHTENAAGPSTSNTSEEPAGGSSRLAESSSSFPSISLDTPTDRDSGESNDHTTFPVRPPLPTTSPRPRSPDKASLETLSLATYRAPEESNEEAGPSNGYLAGYDEGDYVDIHAEDESYDDADLDDDEDEDVEYDPEEEMVYSDVDAEMDIVEGEEENVFAEEDEEDLVGEHNRFFGIPEEEDEDDDEEDARHEEEIRPLSESDDESEEEGHQEAAEHEQAVDDLFREEEEEEEEEEAMDGEGLFDDDDDPQWEAQVIEADVAQVAQNLAGAAVPPVQGLNQDIDPALVPDLNDDMDGNVEDDMEGAMEAIGMRGPIYGVVQNAALMIFVLDTAIGLGVWMPFTIGKTTALLTLDPRRLLQVLHLPIRAMRLVTDPIVDFVVYIIIDLTLPRIGRLLGWLLRLCMLFVAVPLGKLLGQNTFNNVAEFYASMYDKSSDLVNKQIAQIVAWTSSNSTTIQETVSAPSNTTSRFALALPDYLGFTEPYFEVLGREVRVAVTKVQSVWIKLALGSGPTNRVFAVLLGYLVVGFLFCIYLNVLTVGNARTAGIAVRNAVRQQLLVLKVAAFIFIELVTFPLGCGIVLDLCTVWLFPEANLQSRMAFFSQAPLTAMFYHWVAGTMFMYSFAVLLSGCRSVMRPGAMWFIKDPQDQNSHPIRDILDRPTFTQLRKICVSGVMYAFVVALVVGSVAGLLLLGSKSIMPFRWKNREPLSIVPVDLLFLHLFLPYTMQYFRPKRVIKRVATVIWKFLSAKLRITSYFFGGRYPVEEHKPKRFIDNLLRKPTEPVETADIFRDTNRLPVDGSFRRVPAIDSISLPRDMRATAAVTEHGAPYDMEAAALLSRQDDETYRARGNIHTDYTIVYIPPGFRYRVILMIALLWTIGSVILGVCVALPIQLGRSFFRLFTPKDVHDGYSFLAGFYLIWTCYLIAKAVDRLDKRRQRRSSPTNGPRADLAVLVLKRGLLWFAKSTYMAFWTGVVLPVLLAIVVDLYVVLPIRFILNPNLLPRIRVVDEWALGLLYAKIALHAHRIQPPNRITRGLQHIMALGWTRPDPVMATKEVIAPLTGGFLGMIFLPGVLFKVAMHFFPNVTAHLDNRFVFMHVYPAVFVVAGTMRSAIALFRVLSSWSQAVRDKEFLVEMRLKNHDPNGIESADTVFVDAEGDGNNDDVDVGGDAVQRGEQQQQGQPEVQMQQAHLQLQQLHQQVQQQLQALRQQQQVLDAMLPPGERGRVGQEMEDEDEDEDTEDEDEGEAEAEVQKTQRQRAAASALAAAAAQSRVAAAAASSQGQNRQIPEDETTADVGVDGQQ